MFLHCGDVIVNELCAEEKHRRNFEGMNWKVCA